MGAKRNVSKKSHLNTFEFLFKIAVKLGVKKNNDKVLEKESLTPR